VKRVLVLLPLLAAIVAGPAAAVVGGNPRDEKVRLNGADNSLARRAVVRQGDLAAGWTVVPTTGSADHSVRCTGYDPDFSAFTVTGKGRSAFFKVSQGATIASSVQVFATARQASADFKVGTGRALLNCIGAQFLQQLRGAGVSTVWLASKRMSSTPRIGGQSTTYLLVFRITAGRATFDYHVDLLTFQVGRAIGGIAFSAIDSSIEDQTGIARRVAARLS
jgi:hypothetical protein